MVLSLMLRGVGLGISAALSPGPFQSLIIAHSLKSGWRKTLPIIFAPLIGDIPIAIALVFVLGHVPDTFLRAIGMAGALLLLYFAWEQWRSIDSVERSEDQATENGNSKVMALSMGLSMLFLSPGPYLYWSLILGPLLLEALEKGLLVAVGFLFAFYLFSIGGLILLSIILSRLGELSSRIQRQMRLLSIAMMVIIAALLIASAIGVR